MRWPCILRSRFRAADRHISQPECLIGNTPRDASAVATQSASFQRQHDAIIAHVNGLEMVAENPWEQF